VAARQPHPTTDTPPHNEQVAALTWGPDVFLSLDSPDGRCPEVFDITGPPRFLFHGPYIELTPGLWRARANFELSDEAGRRFMAIQFGVEPEYTTADFPRRVEGPVVVEAVHPVRTAGPAQIRLWMKWGAFHGTLRFFGAVVERIGDVAETPEAPNEATPDT